MKRILGLAALLGQALTGLASSYGIQGPHYQRQYGVNRQVRQAYRAGPRPTAARWWHDPKNQAQQAALLKAAEKRKRKAEKLYCQARFSGGQNYYAYAANILNVNK